MISLSVFGWDFLQMTHSRSDSGSVSLVRSLNEDQLSVSSPNLIKHCSVIRSTLNRNAYISKTIIGTMKWISDLKTSNLQHFPYRDQLRPYCYKMNITKSYSSASFLNQKCLIIISSQLLHPATPYTKTKHNNINTYHHLNSHTD
jgi:hypothetical protein